MSTELAEKLEKYIVVSKVNSEEPEYLITRRDNFEKVNLCDCYDNYGQKCDCYNSGCYSIDNSGGSAKNDCIESIYNHFNVTFEKDNLCDDDFDNALTGDNELLEGISIDDIKNFIESWKSENEIHTEVTAWIYHDGSNFKTISIDTSFGEADVCELDDDEQESILNEFTGAVYVNSGASESQETENYIFTSTLYTSDPWIASVVKK